MNDNSSAVNSAVAAGETTPGMPSASMIQTTTQPTVEPEKAEITQSERGDIQGGQVSEQENLETGPDGVKPNLVPYERLKHYVDMARAYEKDATLFRELRSNPQLAKAFLEELGPVGEEVDPRIENANKVLAEMGYITKDSAKEMIREELAFERGVSEFRQQVTELEKKWDGSNGAPKFDAQKVAQFMDEMVSRGNEISDPEIAFELLYRDALADWRAKSKRGTAYSEKPGAPTVDQTDQRELDKKKALESGNFSDFISKYFGPYTN